MPHRYHITVQPLDRLSGTDSGDALTFETTNHDDLLQIVSRLSSRAVVPPDEVAAFAIGLKLFTETLVRHRREPLFEELRPHIGDFMKRLKAHGTAGAEN